MIFIGHIEYFATGEGLRQITFATYATDKQSFIKQMEARVDNEYLMQGLDVYEYDEMIKNNIVPRHLPQYMMDRIARVAGQGHFAFFIDDYVNYS